MLKIVCIFLFFLSARFANAQDSLMNKKIYQNSADQLIASSGKLLIGGYGEVHYNQPLNADTRSNGTLDVHRMVMLFGYNFNARTQFVTELEFEHVSEIYVEQAFIQYKINPYINVKGGLMLIPMGIVNEYHEPVAFNGVERPFIDGKIAPTTWREIGLGMAGNISGAFIKYQAYLVNGFNGFNGKGNLNGSNGFRSGRQKGAESFISSPNFTAKVEFYGMRGLNIGVSGYFGNTQSTLYNGIDKNNNAALARADSSVIGIAMFGVDARYSIKALQLRGQLYYASMSNTDQYNRFTAQDGNPNDLGKSMMGYYAEAAYNVFSLTSITETELIPFIRYEAYNTHSSVDNFITKNDAYNNQAIVTGLTYKLAKGAVAKADMAYVKSKNDDKYKKTFNLGFGIMF
jgi:hypothetical protein